jgi:hypothetical protein
MLPTEKTEVTQELQILLPLINEINSIKNVHIRYWTAGILKQAPEKFWTITASSSGKHHPKWANEVGGLVRHTRLTCQFVDIMSRAYALPQHEIDEIKSAAILHDLHKPDYNHPMLTWMWLQNKQEGIEAWHGNICSIIKYHMGQWTQKPYNKPITEFTKAEWIMHLADMAATNQKLIAVNFD